MFRHIVAVFTALSLIACTSMRPVTPTNRAEWRQMVKVGDEVSVSATNGKTYLLILTVVDEEKIVGTGDNKKVTIRYEQIQTMQVKKVNGVKTAGAVAGTVLAVLAVLIVVGAVLVGRAFEKAGD